MDTQWITEALKFFESIKPAVEGMTATAALLSSGAKAGVYLITQGAKLVSYLITDEKDAPELPTIRKPDVVILVDINRRMLADVSRYMEARGLDADVIIVTNDPAYSNQIRFLDAQNPQEWEALVREFAAEMNKIKHVVGAARVHIFLSVPLALAFAMGTVWGTVDEATVYHWEANTYHPVILISRRLRQGA